MRSSGWGSVGVMTSNDSVTIALVRHGETEWNAIGRFQGVSDVPLNDTGLAQAESVVDFLREQGPWDELRFSPLIRAAKTGEIIADALGIEERRVAPLLAERDWGAGEGKKLVELRELYPELREHPDSQVRRHIPFVEPMDLVLARGRHVINTLAGTQRGKRILCTLHGTILRATMNDLLGEDIGYVPNTGAIVFKAWHEAGELQVEIVARSFEPEGHAADESAQSGSSVAKR